MFIDLTVVEQGNDMAGLLSVQARQEGDFPLQMCSPVAAQAGISLRHGLSIDEFEGNCATRVVHRGPDLTIATRARRQHSFQSVLPAINDNPFAVLHGTFSGFHHSVRV